MAAVLLMSAAATAYVDLTTGIYTVTPLLCVAVAWLLVESRA